MKPRELRGVIAAVPTPVSADYAPDAQRLAKHCRELLAGGCDGINLLGTTGEANSLPVAQRLQLMRDIASSGLPLAKFMVGTGVCSLAESVQLTQAAADLGFAGALVLPPFFYPDPSPAALTAYVDELLKRVQRPQLAIYLYHIPQNTGVAWPLETIVELKKRHAQLVGLKDSSGDLSYSRAVVKAVPGFDVFPSSEASLIHAKDDGFAGCISATTNLTAADSQAAWQGAADAKVRSERATAHRTLLAKVNLVASVKAALAQRYGDAEWMRTVPPIAPRSADDARSLHAALQS
ncbi:dihydrodipicolinate synthase family protein [Ramlibacter sp. PS4R-6]|uniref:dihydrodipicolinate synthase family protein n=1 Tax=Ramlibacter sp. PS4R-6 TaxID=3133438 RepID=UPI0030957505